MRTLCFLDLHGRLCLILLPIDGVIAPIIFLSLLLMSQLNCLLVFAAEDRAKRSIGFDLNLSIPISVVVFIIYS